MSPSDEYRSRLRASLPTRFLREIVPVLNLSYRVARTETAHFPDAELHDLLPVYRRAVVQRNLAIQARKYVRQGLIVKSATNAVENCFHTLVIGGDIILTESAVQGPMTMVRHAMFREGYAVSNQRDFFKEDAEPAPGAKLWALVIHGPGGRAERPAFAKIMFPLPDLSGYVDEGIDLIHDYIADAAASRSMEEQVEETIEVELRKGIRKGVRMTDDTSA